MYNLRKIRYFNSLWKQQLFSFIFLLVLGHSVQAQVYKCENNAGEINFSDEPCSKGESSERLDWLKGATSSKKSTKKKTSSTHYRSSQAKKTAKKSKKNNEAYVLLSLLTTTQLELETASLRSTLNGETSDAPELILPDGITVNLLKVDKIIITRHSRKNALQVRFLMDDGYEEVKIIKKPFPKISGAAKIGRFNKSLADIKRIEFFNSQKLLKMAGKSKVKHKKSVTKVSPLKNKTAVDKEVPVIELDLTHQLPANTPATVSKKKPDSPKIKVVGSQSTHKRTRKSSSSGGIQVNFVNEKQMTLNKAGLSSLKGSQKSRGQTFFLSDNEQIPYDAIKAIKVRPTSKNQLLVAVELKTKEIKMEVMSPPFTRIVGNTKSGTFDHSLSDIKSISFQP